MSTSVSAFEVLRFEAVPAAAGVALLELDGRFGGVVPTRPRLLLEVGDYARELPAVVAGGAPQSWSATFAVPLEAVGEGALFSLIPGRGPVIALPAPDLADGDDDRFVRLARVANDLRHRLAETSASAATASERFDEVAAERDRLTAELAATQERAEAAERRAEETERAAREIRAGGEAANRAAEEAAQELEAVRTQLSAATARAEAAEEATRDAASARDAARSDVERLHEEISSAADEAEELRTKLVAAEDEVRAARRDLRDARAKLERERRLRADHPHHRGAVALDAVDQTQESALRWEDDRADDDTARFTGEDDSARFSGEDDTARFTTDEDELAAAATTRLAPDDPTVPVAVEPDLADPTEPTEPTDEISVEAVVPRPRTPHARRTIKLDPALGDDVLDPAAVGARYIEPSQTRPPLLALTPARIAVGAALLVLLVALVIIFAGGGLV